MLEPPQIEQPVHIVYSTYYVISVFVISVVSHYSFEGRAWALIVQFQVIAGF